MIFVFTPLLITKYEVGNIKNGNVDFDIDDSDVMLALILVVVDFMVRIIMLL